MLLTAGFCWYFDAVEDRHPAWRKQVDSIDKLWHTFMPLASLVLTFFVSNAWSLWQRVYGLQRSVSDNITDLCLLLCTNIKRSGEVLAEGDREWLEQFARYTRLWHLLFYASCSRKLALLVTDPGLEFMLVERQPEMGPLLLEKEFELLKQVEKHGDRHLVVLEWLSAFVSRGFQQELFAPHVKDATLSLALEKLCALRGNSSSIIGELTGRIKMAHAHIVQLLVDAVILLTLVSQWNEIRFWSILSAGLMTCFYQGLLNLSKTFLDPLDNESEPHDSDAINIFSFIAKANANSISILAGVQQLPF